MTQFFRSGGFGADAITDFIFLWGKVTTTGNVTHLRKHFATAGYQVTAGKTLYLVKFRVFPMAAGDQVNNVKVGYADNDVGLDTTTARTNPVMAFGIDDTNNNGLPTWGSISTYPTGLTTHGDDSFGFIWPIAAASKFPFVRAARQEGGSNNPNDSIFAWCIEV